MKRIHNREEVLERLIDRQGGKCPVCDKKFFKEITPKIRIELGMLNDADIKQFYHPQIHHRMPDTDKNIENYPNFIHSDDNLYALHALCHFNNKFFGQIGHIEAKEREEKIKQEDTI